MKKQFLFLAVAIATFMSASAQNLITDGTFETTATGNFTLASISATRSVWGGVDNKTTGTAPIVGVTTGGATGNCAFVTPGSGGSSTIRGFLYQRLPTPSNISTAKTYRLTVKLKAGSTGVKGNLYIRTRGNSTTSGATSPFFAVRADYASDNYAWCKYINGIATSWTEYSQTFVFSNSVSGSVISTTAPSSPAVAFTEADLNDLIFGFYSTSGTVYVDDVVFEEDIAAPTANAANDVAINSFTANWSAVSGAASYRLDVSTNNTFTAILSSYNNLSVSGTSQIVTTGLSANTPYYYRIRAVSNAGTITGNSSTITVTTLDDPSLVKDGSFISASLGDFALTSGIVSGVTRSVWGGVDNTTGGTTAPIVGVTTGGATGNCAFVTPGDIASSTTKGFLYQRLPTPSNINTAKNYRLTVKLKAGSTGVKGNLYIKTRGNSTASSSPFFAVRADYASDNYAWCKYINGIATSWTEYSQTFVFSNSVSGSIISTTSPSSPAVAFTAADLDDLIFGFYSTGGTVYIDDVQLVEDATITGASTASAFTTTYGTASAAQTFSVSGSKLTANLIATAPTGFEVSSGGAYGSTTSFTQTSGSASGTLSIRLAATATVAGSYNLQNIVLSSTGATSVNIVTAASGNVVSAASGSPTGDNLNNSGLSDPQLANTNLTISSGEFIINDTKTVLSLTVAPGAKLTHSSGTLTATNGITLESDATGTATLMDSYTEPTINATVKQYVTAGRNWYMSSPLNNTADYSVLNKGNSVAEYNETTGLWPEVTSGNLTRGKGYVQVASATQGTTGTVSFSGITNSGNVAVTLTNTLAGGKGFNLVGNPYPSYLSWSAVAGNSINTNATTGAKMPTGTMWYRTINYNSKNAWAATTAYTAGDVIYNGTRFYIATSTGTSGATAPTGGVGTTGISDGVVTWDYAGSIYVFATISLDGTATPSTVSNLIPPMQAFWVKSNGGTLTFTNSMRSHESVSNKLKAPKNTANEMPLVRLSVTNGASADEAVIYASTNASNTFDAYDAPKYFNLAGSNQPEIYTQAGNEKLVINAMNELSQGTEIPLGFATEKGNNFTISASELKNFGLDMKVMLKDKQQNTEFNLTNGQAYEFSSDVVNDANRFSVIFRSLGSTTGLNNTEKLNAQVFVNAANQITIIAPEKATYSIYNTVGQLIEKCIVNSKLQTVNCKLNSGVYFVELLLNGQSEIQKVIIR